jgi:hypothetical protein
MKANRETGEGFRGQALGELSSPSGGKPLASVRLLGWSELGHDHAQERLPCTPTHEVRLGFGFGQRLDGAVPERRCGSLPAIADL